MTAPTTWYGPNYTSLEHYAREQKPAPALWINFSRRRGGYHAASALRRFLGAVSTIGASSPALKPAARRSAATSP
jgi:hypothetical protein